MSTRGSALQRTVNYFRECSLDEARAAYQIVKEVMEVRLKGYKAAKVSQGAAASTPRRKRRTKAEIEAAKGTQGTLSTVA